MTQRIPITLYAGPSSDEPCFVTCGTDAESEPISALDAAGSGPEYRGSSAMVAWAQRKLRGLGIDWAGAEVTARAPGNFQAPTHGIEIRTTMRVR